MKTIYVGSDHAGFEMKEKMKPFLESLGYTVVDLGNTKYDSKDDYPDFGIPVAKKVVKSKAKGILFCGSAEGICIAANKVKGARAVAVQDTTTAKLSRSHNDANILCLAGGKTKSKIKGLGISLQKAKTLSKIWLNTKFSQQTRHKRRIKKIARFEK